MMVFLLASLQIELAIASEIIPIILIFQKHLKGYCFSMMSYCLEDIQCRTGAQLQKLFKASHTFVIVLPLRYTYYVSFKTLKLGFIPFFIAGWGDIPPSPPFENIAYILSYHIPCILLLKLDYISLHMFSKFIYRNYISNGFIIQKNYFHLQI